jgi:oligosaccharide reducing-end xylanase
MIPLNHIVGKLRDPNVSRSARALAAAAAVALGMTACQTPTGSSDAKGSGAFTTGHYRNLFAEAGHSQHDIQEKVDSAYQQLFHGNPTNQAVFFWASANSNGPLAYVTDIKHHDVRTEGLSYGMMISVQLNHKPEFDALWNWSKTYLYNPETNNPSYGFFAWQARTNGVRMSQFVAPDGEEYYATALFFAAARWGKGTGIYNYHAEATQLLDRMRNRAVITGMMPGGNQRRAVTAGPLFDADHKMVLFSPSNERNRFTDPSYHLPAFYELWSRWGPAADRDFWAGAAVASRDFFPRVTDPVTGLNPNYANFDGSLVTNSFSRNVAEFRFDAWRTEMNWSVDWSWWAADPREQELSDRLQGFFESKGMNDYGCQFTLEGRPLDNRHAIGMIAMNGVASLAATQPRAKEFAEALWNTPPQDGLERYYDGLLYMMALLHCSGEFRIWTPR